MMVETDASDHTIAGILLVTTKDNEIQPVAFFSHSLQGVEKNYDTHDKELLAIFEAFKNWQHFLEGSAEVINTVTDHKNLEYFTSSKKLLCHQARWAEFLGQFNMKVQFRPGRLGSKLDALTCRWDVYMEGDNLEPAVTNVCPVFTTEQLAGTLVLVHTKPYSLLKQLPIPSQPWESISMDFIEQLPTSEGFTVILVIVDRLTKQSLFIPTHDMVDAPQLA